jgi:hypothetical protein
MFKLLRKTRPEGRPDPWKQALDKVVESPKGLIPAFATKVIWPDDAWCTGEEGNSPARVELKYP